MTQNEIIDVAIQKVAALELENTGNSYTYERAYRQALKDAVKELKTLRTDE